MSGVQISLQDEKSSRYKPAAHIGSPGSLSWTKNRYSWLRYFGFTQPLLENAKIITQITAILLMSARLQMYLSHYSTQHKLKNCQLSLRTWAASNILYITVRLFCANYSTTRCPYFKNFTPTHHVSCEKVVNLILCDTAMAWFPDEGPFRIETRRNVQCDNVI